MAFNRELSQFANYLELDASANYIGIAANKSADVGIGNSAPDSKLTVTGDAKVSGVVTATTFIGAVTGNVTGDLTGTADDATVLETARNFSITGDGSASAVSFNGSSNVELDLTLDTVNSNTGSFGSSTAIPVVTVNGKGLVTAVTTAAVGTALTVAGDSGSEDIDLLTETFTITGNGNNVITSAASNAVDIQLNPNVAITDLSASGVVTATSFHTGAVGSAIQVNSETITGPSSITIDPAGVGDNTGVVHILGNLQVEGTTTTIDSTTVNIADKNIQVATGAANDAAADGAGFTIDSGEGDKTFQFEATGDNFGSSENMNLASSKEYKINNTSVLSATTLGSAVVNSSLTSVGTLGSLNVSGALTGAHINASGIVTASSFSGSGSGLSAGTTPLTTLDIDGATDIGADLADADLIVVDDGAGGTNRKAAMSRVKDYVLGGGSGATFEQLSVTGIATIGQTQSTGLVVSGVSTVGVVTSATSIQSSVFYGPLTGNVTGDVTGNADTATALATARDLSLTGDATATISGFDGSANGTAALTLATVNSNTGSFGSQTAVPVITVNGKGLITAVSTAAVGSALTITGDSGSEDIDLLTESLSITGGSNVTSTAASNGVEVALNDNISLTSVVTSGVTTASSFATGASGSAIIVTSSTITGPSSITIDPSAVGDNTGTVHILGDLQVEGTTTTIDSTTVNIADKNIQVATGAANDAAANGAGFTIDSGDGDKTFQFEATGDNFGSSENLNLASGKTYKINNTDVLSATTLGSAVVSSSLTSVGTLGSLNVAGATTLAHASISGVTTATGGVVGDLTGDVTGNVTGNVTGFLVGNVDAASGISTFNNVELGGYVSIGDTHGQMNQVLASVGAGVTWKTIADVLPQTRTTQTNTATAGQTAFSFDYNVNYLDVFINGVKLDSSEFTASNGTAITLSEGAFVGDKVEFISYATAGAGSGTVSSANDLTDVTLSSTAENEILVYNGSGFVNRSELALAGVMTATSFSGPVTGNVTGSLLSGNVNAGVVTATDIHTGAEGSAIRISTNTISGPATLTLDPSSVGDNTGTVVIAGDLTVNGNTTTINSTTLTVDDLNIVVASGAADAAAADGAGLTVDGASATFTYAATGDKFVSNKDVEAPNFNATSDITLKENVSIIDNALDMINNLNGISWNWKADGRASLGVSAQNVETVAPQLVSNGSTHKAVNYNGLIGILIEAVKEQSNQISDLRAELALKANSRRKRK